MGIAFIAAVAIAAAIVIYKKADPDEKKFLAIMFITAFLLRAVVAVLYQWYIDTWRDGLALATDESYYLSLAWYKTLLLRMKDALHLAGEYAPRMDPFTKFKFVDFVTSHTYKDAVLAGGFIYSLILSFLYFVFGYSVLAARFFNILIGTLTCLWVYFIARSTFGRNVARLSFVFLIFMPAQIFLSISVIRDILMIFCTTLMLVLIYKIKNIKGFFVLLIPIALLLCLAFKLLPPLSYFLLILLGISLFIKILDFRRRKLISFIIIVAILGAGFNNKTLPHINTLLRRKYVVLVLKHIATGGDPGAASYKLLPDNFYTIEDYLNRNKKSREVLYSRKGYYIDQLKKSEAVFNPQKRLQEQDIIEEDLFLHDTKGYMPGACLRGLFYAFFKPFPWEAKKATQALASMQMIIWYLFFPFVCIELYGALRHLTKDKAVFIIFFFGLASGVALIEGNIGALFRHRELFSFAYITFGIAGCITLLPKDI